MKRARTWALVAGLTVLVFFYIRSLVSDLKPRDADFTDLFCEGTGTNIWSQMKVSEGAKFEAANASFLRQRVTREATYSFENGTVLSISNTGLRLNGSPVELESKIILITKDGVAHAAFIRTFE
jgi:hypothetical protein